MKLTASREDILTPLQSVIGVVERRQTMPVLANVLLSARDDRLTISNPRAGSRRPLNRRSHRLPQ